MARKNKRQQVSSKSAGPEHGMEVREQKTVCYEVAKGLTIQAATVMVRAFNFQYYGGSAPFGTSPLDKYVSDLRTTDRKLCIDMSFRSDGVRTNGA